MDQRSMDELVDDFAAAAAILARGMLAKYATCMRRVTQQRRRAILFAQFDDDVALKAWHSA